ncbi:hypothetical protein [Haloechinothrix sp. LS1_15]|uniref:hypothetical protein n=1 Tax=Haloechinothrix sp. LS1_15 TaxID=2652248 RepID=UPI0029479230|nr:hypothetical protein [Haloechinothrix sp. LS1_15]MDV6013695.1 hypothetical protein [Haloechinothrix sp. LS1_15]
MKRAATVMLAAIMISGCGGDVDSDADSTPPTATPDADGDEDAGSYTVRVSVSGPDDTIMVVERDGQQSPVSLGGEPFDFEFTEDGTDPAELDIAVFAKTEDPTGGPVRCAISVDSETIVEDSATAADGNGLAEVGCTMPRTT